MSKTHSSLGSKIIIAGGTGFLGQLLASSFLEDDYDVVILSRRAFPSPKYGRVVCWDGKSLGKWTDHLDGAKVLVNLTGRSTDCRHTPSNKKEIIESRVLSTRVLGKAFFYLATNHHRFGLMPALWLCMVNALEMHLLMMKIHQFAKMIFWKKLPFLGRMNFINFTKAGTRQISLGISFILGIANGAFPLLKIIELRTWR